MCYSQEYWWCNISQSPYILLVLAILASSENRFPGIYVERCKDGSVQARKCIQRQLKSIAFCTNYNYTAQ